MESVGLKTKQRKAVKTPRGKRGASPAHFRTQKEAVAAAKAAATGIGGEVVVKSSSGQIIARSSHKRQGRARKPSAVIMGELVSADAVPRASTSAAKQAQRDFARLRGYFESSSSLALALGWSAPTVRAWMSEETFPNRPRMRSVETVGNFLDLASHVDGWVSDPFDVGRWMIEPREDLEQLSPAKLVEHLRSGGVEWIAERLPILAPRIEAVKPIEPVSFERLDEVLANFDAPAVSDVDPVSIAEEDLALLLDD